MVLSVEFITWFPSTEAAVLSTEAERVGVYKANTWLEKDNSYNTAENKTAKIIDLNESLNELRREEM